MKQYTFLNEFIFDVSNAGGVGGAIIGTLAPSALFYLYQRLIKLPKYKKELKLHVYMLSDEELDNEIKWVVDKYSELLNSNKVAANKIKKVTEVVALGQQILNNKDTPLDIKRNYIIDVTYKYHLVSRISYNVLGKYDRNFNPRKTILMLYLLNIVCGSLTSYAGAELYRNF